MPRYISCQASCCPGNAVHGALIDADLSGDLDQPSELAGFGAATARSQGIAPRQIVVVLRGRQHHHEDRSQRFHHPRPALFTTAAREYISLSLRETQLG